MLGLLGTLLLLRVAELLMNASSSLDIAHMLAGGLVLVELHAALPGPHVRRCSTCSRCTPWCCRRRWPGRRYIQDAPHLYVTAAIALVLKAIIIPVALRRVVVRLGIHRTIETVVGIGPTMLAGMGLVALSMVVMLKATADGRSAGARGPGVRAFGRAARAADDGDAAQRGQPDRRLHVAGERPDPCRHRRQGHAAGGRDQRRLLGAGRLHRHRRVPVPHPRALRLGRRRRRSTTSAGSGDERLACPVCRSSR